MYQRVLGLSRWVLPYKFCVVCIYKTLRPELIIACCLGFDIHYVLTCSDLVAKHARTLFCILKNRSFNIQSLYYLFSFLFFSLFLGEVGKLSARTFSPAGLSVCLINS
uniref:Uncharacterized protein n=1 Tax=Opuntia streptacantha TaxID=393608 RepID=A0A7C9DN41_OPUST